MSENKENVPKIRFPGFTDAWEQRRLGDVLTEKRRPIKMEDDEEYQLVTVKRRNMGIVSRGYFKGKDILVKNYFEIRTGDYLISKRQVIHGANGIVPKSLDKSIVSNEYLVSVGNKNISTEFWTLISKQSNMYRQFFLSSYGVDIEKLVFDVEDWKKRTIMIPSLPEQEKITLFFQRLDNLITLHQRKLNNVKKLKAGLLQKMFPKDGEDFPEVRFPGFTDAWEQRKVIDIAPLQRGFDLPISEMQEGKYPVVMSNGIGAYHSKYKAKAPGVVTGRSGTIGNVHYIEDNYWPHNTALWVTDFKGNVPLYVYYMYQRLDLNRYGTGSGVPTLNRNDVHDAKTYIPKNDEQAKIADLFRTLDHLITLHQRKLKHLQEQKKALLQQMFV